MRRWLRNFIADLLDGKCARTGHDWGYIGNWFEYAGCWYCSNCKETRPDV